MNLTRRSFLAGAALTVSCGRKLAGRYAGWLFVASASERSIAIADLSEFRRAGSISLPQAPAQLLRMGERVFATSPEARAIFQIDMDHQQLGRRIGMPGKLVSAAVVPGSGGLLAAAVAEPSHLCLIDGTAGRIAGRIALPDVPGAMDLTEGMAAIAAETGDTVTWVSLRNRRITGVTRLGTRANLVRFRNDGQMVLAGAPDTRQILTVDAATGKLLARLPVPFAPTRFCFNADGGQMFVTGVAEDSLAIVSPYQSEVDQTIVAGRTPGAMAVDADRNLLFVANPASGDLTVLNIETRQLAVSVHIGGSPGEILLTPDGEYALIVGQGSGYVSVVRLRTVLDTSDGGLGKIKARPLFTVFPTAASPLSAVIVPARS